MVWLIVILAVVAVLLLIGIALYNRFVRLRNRVDNAWAQIEVQLKRRWDLIPNLVETVKGYAAHERGTFEAVTNARAAAQAARTPGESAQAEGLLGQALGRLFAVAEAYPSCRPTRTSASSERARRDREPDRRLAPGLQRHRAHLPQRDPDPSPACCSQVRSASRNASSSNSRTRLNASRHVDFGTGSPWLERRVTRLRRSVGALAAVALTALAVTGVADAESYSLPRSGRPGGGALDGALDVVERISFAFAARSGGDTATSRCGRANR